MPELHILLERALTYPRRSIDLRPAGCEYDVIVGAWISVDSGRLWVETPDRVGPETKKADIETGEDQKAE